MPKEKFFENTEKLLQPFIDMGAELLNGLSENKKLLHEIEMNQQKLQQKLDLILSKELKNSDTKILWNIFLIFQKIKS